METGKHRPPLRAGGGRSHLQVRVLPTMGRYISAHCDESVQQIGKGRSSVRYVLGSQAAAAVC